MLGPKLAGNLVTLVPTPHEMVELWPKWVSDPEVTRYLLMPFVPAPHMEEEWYKNASESRTDVLWALEVEGRIVGSTGIHDIHWIPAHGTTGLVIGDKTYWRRGIASEAMALRTRYAFRELNLHKLKSSAFMENQGSRRALAKAGYREVGVHREEFFRDGRWHDLWLGEVLREEWERTHGVNA